MSLIAHYGVISYIIGYYTLISLTLRFPLPVTGITELNGVSGYAWCDYMSFVLQKLVFPRTSFLKMAFAPTAPIKVWAGFFFIEVFWK